MSVWQRFWRWFNDADEQERQQRSHERMMELIRSGRVFTPPSPVSVAWRKPGGLWPTEESR